MAHATLLTARDLVVDLITNRTQLRAVDGVSYEVGAGETLAIVGESGSGKTVMNLAPLGLMPVGVEVQTSGSLMFGNVDLLSLDERDLRAVRGKSIGTIFQDPMSALNPARRIGRQIAEVMELHSRMSTFAAEKRALDLVKLVGISDPETRLKQYPHELSGGLRQRVMIAIAIAAEPKLLIADEPTTALDVTVQAQILALLKKLQRELRMAMILITHDMGVVAACASRVAVMYAGRIAEYGAVDQVLVRPVHPYTAGLIYAIPRAEDSTGTAFRGLPGIPPVLAAPIEGCAFAPRCPRVLGVCSKIRPKLLPVESGSVAAACHAVSAAARSGEPR